MKWKKDNGQEIETNDLPATIEYCESIGWKPIEAKKETVIAPKEKKAHTKKKVPE